MEIKAILFDLDGTLLPMDQDKFVGAYFKLLTTRMAAIGYDPKKFGECLWKGVGNMVKNDGSRKNTEAFWEVFVAMFGEASMKDKPYVDEFYRQEFNQIQKVCGFTEKARQIIDAAKATGKKVILATNPLFPPTATENRIRWAGLTPDDFYLYTTYDNSTFCKPNPKYYFEILEKIDCKPEECVMIGNDVDEDMIAEKLGMKVFLLTDYLINKNDEDIEKYPHGNYDGLLEFLNTL